MYVIQKIMILSLKYYPAPGPCLNNIRNLSDIYQNFVFFQQYAANTYIKKSYIHSMFFLLIFHFTLMICIQVLSILITNNLRELQNLEI